LAFTRYCFTSWLLCTNQPSLYCPPLPPALPTPLQYYCTSIAQYTTPPPTPLLYAIHYTILATAISCEGQSLQEVTAASSGTHAHASGKSWRLAWRCLARPSTGCRVLPEGSRRDTGGGSETGRAILGICRQESSRVILI